MKLHVIRGHRTYGPFPFEEVCELKTNVSGCIYITVEMRPAALVLADAQTADLGLFFFAFAYVDEDHTRRDIYDMSSRCTAQASGTQ